MALVTGGSRGIGAAIARSLAAAGADVADAVERTVADLGRIWATALKHSDGLARLAPAAVAIVAAVASFALLAAALARLPVGTAYAVCVGIGAAGVAIAGVIATATTSRSLASPSSR